MDQAVTFFDLLHTDPNLGPDEAQRRAATELPAMVQRSAMKWLPTPTHSNGVGDKLRIGVAVWSGYDLRLLDLVTDAKPSGIAVEVFNMDAAFADGTIEQFLPGLGSVFHPPVVGHWVGGNLVKTASGYDARQLVGRVIGFDPKLALERPVASNH